MIYLDTSVALAALLAEDRTPPPDFWQEEIVSSRLLQYEVMSRLHAYGADQDQLAAASDLVGGLVLIELSSVVLGRALEPFPTPVRTHDALHLATALYLAGAHARIALATYDRRMAEAARALKLRVLDAA